MNVIAVLVVTNVAKGVAQTMQTGIVNAGKETKIIN